MNDIQGGSIVQLKQRRQKSYHYVKHKPKNETKQTN